MSQIEISNEIYEAHRKLSHCSTRFIDFVKDNPEALKRANFNDLLNDKRFDYFRSQPWPTFINQETKKEMTEAAVAVLNLIKSVPARLFDNDPIKVSRYYGIPEDECKWMLYAVDDNNIRRLLARGDFIFSPYQGLKCIEFNIYSNIGGWELDLLEPMYINTPVTSEFLKKYNVRLHKNMFFPDLMEHICQQVPGPPGFDTNEEINVAVVHPEYSEDKELQVLLRQLAKHYYLWQKSHAAKGEILFCHLDQLQIVDHRVMVSDKHIHIMIEMYNGNIPMLIMDTVKKRNVLMYNGPIGVLLSHKLNLALLSEYQDTSMFTPGEKEIIKKYIPWTRKIVPGFTTYGQERIKLDQFIISNRERLVMKGGTGYGGFDVVVGSSTPAALWKQRMEQVILEKNWIIQEFVPSCSYLYQEGEQGYAKYHAIWGLFYFGSRYAGGFVRILPEKGNRGVINTHQGAEESIILEVEE